MKNKIRILSAVVLTAIYCFAVGAVKESLTHSDFQNNSTTSQEQYFSDFSTKLFCHTSQTESSVSNINNLPAPNFKNSINELWTIAKTTEHLFETAFSQYTNISRNFLIQYRKTDIIFPFHYFW
ncbi:MAG: hypothetical protein JXL97_13965 [Bacteroidales bacterium]|nr:hypothetical protein [Bacteroidales bacterium]